MIETKSSDERGTVFGIKFVDPEEVIKNLEISAGMKVADFGCGAGHFTMALAGKVGETGAVYALDILPEKLEATTSAAKGRNFTNIITRRVNLEKVGGSKIDTDSIDWVIIKDMLFQNKNRSIILEEAKRILKNGGKILIIEWSLANSSIGPDRQLRLSKEAIVSIAQGANLGFLKDVPVGNFHCGLIFGK